MFLKSKFILFKSIFVLPYFLPRVGIALFLFVLGSCVQDSELPQGKQSELDQTAQIAPVRAWFEANKGSLRLPERGSNFRTGSQELILPFFEKEPDWDKVHHYFFRDGREVFEVSLENKEIFIPSLGEQQQDQQLARRSIQNILFVKHPTEARFDPLIVRYYPDVENSKRDFKDINYQMIDEKWSGTVDLFTYDEHFFIGFEIYKGRILATRKVEVTGEGGRRGISPEQLDIRCSVTTTDWYQVYYNYETRSWVTLVLSPTRSYSCAVGGPQGEDSGAGGNYSYLPGDSFPSGGGALGSYNPPDVPLPMLRIYIDSSIKDNPRLDCIVGKLGMSAFVNSIAELTKTKDKNTNSILKLGATKKSDAYGETKNVDGFNEITINNSLLNRPDLMIARTIFHELAHAEIMAALKENRITPIDGNFPANLDLYITFYLNTAADSTKKDDLLGNRHHNYMAANLLPVMGRGLMNFHREQFPEEFKQFSDFMKDAGYPKGLTEDFYMNLFWEGLETTTAYKQMAAITVQPPFLSPFDKMKNDLWNAGKLTKPCGN
ncbi:MAG: hypothetical protein FJX97_02180 [Bacteroidetes bacterium]|nr:hypothetical protein [Bacteroidota bacterium]